MSALVTKPLAKYTCIFPNIIDLPSMICLLFKMRVVQHYLARYRGLSAVSALLAVGSEAMALFMALTMIIISLALCGSMVADLLGRSAKDPNKMLNSEVDALSIFLHLPLSTGVHSGSASAG